LIGVAGVVRRLAAARLVEGEGHLEPGSLQEANRRHSNLGREPVNETSDEELAHTRHPLDVSRGTVPGQWIAKRDTKQRSIG
jgi:hypothetical protein